LSGGFEVKPTPKAAGQIRKESRWWRKNRTRAPNLFRDELKQACALVADHPEIGAEAEDTDMAGVRRVVTVATQHYVYYRIDYIQRRIQVLAVWSTSRGEPPEF
jgi:plasmid stabilization system protein ParE